jgi:ABC-type glutathione transport system ATPase component
MTGQPLLSVQGVSRTFVTRGRARSAERQVIRALADVDLELFAGERVGVVGESGSGKSTLARAIVGLTPVDRGTINFDGVEVGSLRPSELRRMRARLQLVLQDPVSSLDPRMTVLELVREGLDAHGTVPASDREPRVVEILERCGIPSTLFGRKSSGLSGGQRQRVALARGLVLRPSLVVLDEPVSALDVSVQSQILNLLLDLQDHYHLTYLFIVHDLALARWFCDRVAVMYRGCVVESGTSEEIFASPQHAYTQQLLAASPSLLLAGRED